MGEINTLAKAWLWIVKPGDCRMHERSHADSCCENSLQVSNTPRRCVLEYLPRVSFESADSCR
jgi:hypothetical protein